MLSQDVLDTGSKGSYVLLIRVAEAQIITVGRLGTIPFPSGDYAYIGSALNGAKARLERHLRKEKKIHWHIDYLLQRSDIRNVIVCQTEERVECSIVEALNPHFDVIQGFGSSDCRCPGHLFSAPQEMEQQIMTTLDSLGLEPQMIDCRNPEVTHK
mgnify:FL=1